MCLYKAIQLMRNDKLLENAYSQKHIKMACKYNAAAWPC